MSTEPTETENFIRGQAFRSSLHVMEELLGPGGRERVLVALSPELRDAFQYGRIVSAAWFPISWYRDFHRAVATVAPGTADIHKQIGRVSAEQDIRGVYKFILSFASPSFAVTQTGRLLGTFIKTVKHEVISQQPDSVALRLEIPGMSRALWEDTSGAAETALRICGGKSPRVHIRTRPGQRHADLLATWS